MSGAHDVPNEHLEITANDSSRVVHTTKRRRSTTRSTDDSPWERLRSAVLDPSMSAAAHSYVLGGESKNFVRDDESEHLHDTDIRVVGPSRGPRRALEWCFQPYKSTTAARGIAWSFAGAVDPECFWNRLWAALMFGAVVFQIYALMYASAFLNTGASWPARLDVEMLIVDILYIIDIIYKQFLGYMDAGNKIMDLKSIRRKYWRSWWAPIDVISALPIDMIALAFGHDAYTFRIPKLLRFIHIPVTLGKWEQYLPVRRRFLSRWFMTLFYGCTLAHCMGMMWLYVAREFPEQSDFVPTPQQLALDEPSLYLAALYWGFGACVGTINPGEPAPGMQSVFSIFVSFTGVLFVAYTIGSVHRMVGHMQKSVAALRHKLNTVDQFMKHNDMPTELRDKVLRYHTFLFDVSGGRGEEEEALRQLPRCVRFELSYALVRDTVRQVPLFSGCPESLLRSLVRLLRPQIAVAEEVVVEARTFVAELFIVHWGRLSVTGKSPSARRQLGAGSVSGPQFLEPGSYFGQLDDSSPTSVSVTAVTFCHLFTVSTETLHKLLKVFPEAKEAFFMNSTRSKKRTSGWLTGLASKRSDEATGLRRFVSNFAPSLPSPKPVSPTSAASSTRTNKTRRHSLMNSQQIRWLTEASSQSTANLLPSTLASVRSVYDSSVDDQDIPIVVHPDSRLQRWRLFLFIVIVMYSCISVPARIVFAPEQPAWPVLLVDFAVVDVFYWLHIVLSFRTAFISRGTLVVDPREIAAQYGGSHFVLDVAAALPGDLLWLALGYSPWFRVNRLLHIVRMNGWFEELTLHSQHYLQLRLIKLLGGLVLVYHLAACCYFMLVRIDGYGAANAWLPEQDVYEHADAWTQFSRALWFVVKPRGMGRHLRPEGNVATGFSLALMAFGFMLYAYLIGNIGALLTSADYTASAFRHHKELVEVYMEAQKVPNNVRYHVLDFFKVQWDAMNGAEHRDVVGDLPVSLQTDVMYELCAKHIRRIRFFSTASDELLRDMVATLAVEMLPCYQVVYRAGDVGHAMYFVAKGTLEILSASSRDYSAGPLPPDAEPGVGDRLALLGQGDFFGEGSLVYHRRTATVRTASACELLLWDYVAARPVLASYPAVWVKLKVIANRRREQVLSRLGIVAPLGTSTPAGLHFEDGVNIPLNDLQSRAQKLSIMAFLGARKASKPKITQRVSRNQDLNTALTDTGSQRVGFYQGGDSPYSFNPSAATPHAQSFAVDRHGRKEDADFDLDARGRRGSHNGGGDAESAPAEHLDSPSPPRLSDGQGLHMDSSEQLASSDGTHAALLARRSHSRSPLAGTATGFEVNSSRMADDGGLQGGASATPHHFGSRQSSHHSVHSRHSTHSGHSRGPPATALLVGETYHIDEETSEGNDDEHGSLRPSSRMSGASVPRSHTLQLTRNGANVVESERMLGLNESTDSHGFHGGGVRVQPWQRANGEARSPMHQSPLAAGDGPLVLTTQRRGSQSAPPGGAKVAPRGAGIASDETRRRDGLPPLQRSNLLPPASAAAARQAASARPLVHPGTLTGTVHDGSR